MAKAKSPKKGKRGSRVRSEQQHLEGTEPEKNTRVHPKALAYVAARDERMLRTKDESDAHKELVDAMNMEGLENYTCDGVSVSIINNRKAKVRVEGANGPADEGDDE